MASPETRRSSVPAKRLGEMSPEERLASLQEYANEQKYVRPGEGGTLPFGPGALMRMEFGGLGAQSSPYSGPVRYTPSSQYTAPLAPPSYETTQKDDEKAAAKKTGRFKQWMEKRKEKKQPRIVN